MLSREEKIKMLKGLQNGKVSIDEIRSKSFSLSDCETWFDNSDGTLTREGGDITLTEHEYRARLKAEGISEEDIITFE